jgi:uncharacterized protein (TIGR03083 family)
VPHRGNVLLDLPTRPCPIAADRSLRALATELDALDEIVAAISAADLARPTRCTDWHVELLVAHLVRGLDQLRAYLAEGFPTEPPSIGWLSYWTTIAVVADSASITERAREFAGSVNDRTIAGVWEEVHERALTVAHAAPPDRGVPTPFGVLRLDHYLPTRVLEVTVHGLDLRHALGLEEVVSPDGLALTAMVLDNLLPGDRSPGLEDDLTFVLAATGRLPTDDSRLPLIS